MRIPRLLLLGAAFLVRPLTAAAQRPAPLTLERAVVLARANSPLARAAAGRRQVIEGRARADAAQPNPTLELRRENVRSPLQRDEFATVTLPVDVTGRRLALRAAAARATDRGIADSVLAMRQVEFDAARAWVRAALAAGLAEVTADQRAAYERLAEFDARRFAEGAVSEAVAVRGRLEADRTRFVAAQAAGEAARAGADLGRLLALPTAPLLAALSDAPLALSPVSADDAVAAAIARRPELAAARALARESELRARAEWMGILPDLALQSGYKGTAGFRTATVGVTFTVPVLQWNGGQRQRAAGERLIADAELRDTEARIRAEARAAAVAFAELSRAGVAVGPDFEARAALVAASAESAYREGATSQFELLDAHRARAEARAVALRAAADLWLARLDLHRAMGASLLEDH